MLRFENAEEFRQGAIHTSLSNCASVMRGQTLGEAIRPSLRGSRQLPRSRGRIGPLSVRRDGAVADTTLKRTFTAAIRPPRRCSCGYHAEADLYGGYPSAATVQLRMPRKGGRLSYSFASKKAAPTVSVGAAMIVGLVFTTLVRDDVDQTTWHNDDLADDLSCDETRNSHTSRSFKFVL